MKDACLDFRELISLQMDDEIDEIGRERLASHLASCSACRAEQGLWLRIRSLLPLAESASSGGIAMKVLDGIRRRRLQGERTLGLIRRTAAAAAIVIVAAVGVLIGLPDRNTPETVVPRASRDLGPVLITGHTNGPARELTLEEGGIPR